MPAVAVVGRVAIAEPISASVPDELVGPEFVVDVVALVSLSLGHFPRWLLQQSGKSCFRSGRRRATSEWPGQLAGRKAAGRSGYSPIRVGRNVTPIK